MKVYSLPLWPLQSIKFQRVVGCAFIPGTQQAFQRPSHPKNSPVHSQILLCLSRAFSYVLWKTWQMRVWELLSLQERSL